MPNGQGPVVLRSVAAPPKLLYASVPLVKAEGAICVVVGFFTLEPMLAMVLFVFLHMGAVILTRPPSIVLEKIRRGDRDVDVSLPDVKLLAHHTPVLVDDIVSTARTMIEGVRHLTKAGASPVCLAIHGIFAGRAYEDLIAAGAALVVTTDTVPHETNGISTANLLAQGVRDLLNNS